MVGNPVFTQTVYPLFCNLSGKEQEWRVMCVNFMSGTKERGTPTQIQLLG